MGASTAIKSFFKVFTDEPYTYVVDLPMHEVKHRLKTLLNSEGFLSGPNIGGTLWGTTFTASKRWTIGISRGGPVASLHGTLERVETGIAIHLTVQAHFRFILYFIIIIFISLMIMLTSIVLPKAVVEGNTRLEQFLIGAVFLPASLIFWGMLKYHKSSLRQTFEENMDIQPIDTHSV